MKQLNKFLALSGLMVLAAPAGAAQTIATDLVVQGSTCTGFDCVSSESFGFDTLRLKENNLRIHFDDTSTSASFPSNDWRIIINDSSNGGANYFAIEDSTAGTQPFRVDAGAGAHAIRIESGGNVGIGTSNPVVELQVTDGDSPTLRLEQDGSSGFTPQTFDIAANETNFFVRDVTNSSQLPFRIKPGADTDSLFIAANNNIGLGTDSPGTSLHIRRTDGTATVKVEDVTTTVANREMLRLENKGSPYMAFHNTDQSATWQVGMFGNNTKFKVFQDGIVNFQLSADASLVLQDLVNNRTEFQVDADGNGTFLGNVDAVAFNPSSSRELKHNFRAVDPGAVLSAVNTLDISRWSFKHEGDDIVHLGPMAEDFHVAFGGLGVDDKHISLTDSSGVALAAIQALSANQRAKDAEITELRSALADRDRTLAALQRRLDRLETTIARVAAQDGTRPVGYRVPASAATGL